MELNGFKASPFVIVSARTHKNVASKVGELKKLGLPFIIICGEKVNNPNLVYREVIGKWDALNCASKFIPKEANIIVLNDVDTQIHNFEDSVAKINKFTDIIYCKVRVLKGPQMKFYKILDPIRKICHITASGELMLMNKEVFRSVIPIPVCIAEDSYILFRALELGYRAKFDEATYVTTERTSTAKQEEVYKHRTTLGIYQALDHSKPPVIIRFFYLVLPFLAPLLSLGGEDGRAWTRGIRRAVEDHLVKKNPTMF